MQSLVTDCLAPEPRDRPEVVRVQQILKLLSCENRTFGISIRCWPPCGGCSLNTHITLPSSSVLVIPMASCVCAVAEQE